MKEKRKRRPKMCPSCGKQPSTKAHTCPYKEDLYGDKDTLCNCCVDCQNNCCADI